MSFHNRAKRGLDVFQYNTLSDIKNQHKKRGIPILIQTTLSGAEKFHRTKPHTLFRVSVRYRDVASGSDIRSGGLKGADLFSFVGTLGCTYNEWHFITHMKKRISRLRLKTAGATSTANEPLLHAPTSIRGCVHLFCVGKGELDSISIRVHPCC